ncbi:MAG: transcription-repair coupling factor [Verrucomicrobiota bacterium]
MRVGDFFENEALSPLLEKIRRAREEKTPCSLRGLPSSAQAFVLAAWKKQNPETSALIFAPHIRWQEELATNLEAWNAEHLFYPEILSVDRESLTDPHLQAERMAALSALQENPRRLIVTTEAALEQSTPAPVRLKEGKLVLKKGKEISLEKFKEKLAAAGYEREALVVEQGQFTHRGGIVDCFSRQAELPVRVEWAGDEIESIREFDPVEQTSVRELEATEIQLCSPEMEQDASLLDYFAEEPFKIFLGGEEGEEISADFTEHLFLHGVRGDQVLAENRRNLLEKYLRDWTREDWKIFLSCNNEGEQQRLKEWLGERQETEQFQFFISPLLKGFSWHAGKMALLTDAEIFGRYQTLRGMRKQKFALERRRSVDFAELELGDYVVHVDHGIALYHGIQAMPDGQSALLLEYADSAKLYVPMEQAFLVSKYVGVGKRHPALDTLGGARWEKAKEKTQKAVMDYAAELLKIHAERESLQSAPFSADAEWQKEFEEAFLYQETPDQETAITETKLDMENPRPMDRLICGDVGFGKTEVAIRAAFKAVMDGRQVAILTPTTVLARQHWNTLRERMADWPVNVELLNRFRTKAEQNKVVKGLESGEVDIVVGTHRLLGADVKFKNLGLVVIDEEQRFGVKQKEKFKTMFRMVDILTLSATPIPRTLYLALMGARDMSSIETPPPNRLPVETSVCAYDERLIRAAIERELERGGQVFFLHNRVRTIERVAERMRHLLPKARIEIGHGQMDKEELEDVMERFVLGEVDVLISTTIIENGIDIPNANTIIIDRADRFGLADLYQLRGRVGRAQNRAYALLMLPREMTGGDAGKRVQAIQQYTQLGSGYKIAMRDLEIRGAGNLLGTAQSGHITAVGFDLYCRLLKRAVARLKGKETSELREVYLSFDFLSLQQTAETAYAHIPASYMSETAWRIAAYRELAELRSIMEWERLKKKWRDRFGALPESVEWLLGYHRVRLRAAEAGFEKVEVKENKLMLTRNADFVMLGHQFPRLTEELSKSKLQEIEKWIISFVPKESSA